MSLNLLEQLKAYGVGHRRPDDVLFADDKPPPKYGIHDLDEENLCHNVIKTTCHIFGCGFTSDTLLDFENHYNAAHRYTCAQCKKVLPSPHLLDLHIQESHDTFFAVMAERKPSIEYIEDDHEYATRVQEVEIAPSVCIYCCYIEDCKEKFPNPQERLCHCIKVHKLPKDYRFDQMQKQKGKKPRSKNKKNSKKTNEYSMELEDTKIAEERHMVVEGSYNKEKIKKFAFANNKQKVFYSGKKFTNDSKETKQDVNIDEVMIDLKDSLPS